MIKYLIFISKKEGISYEEFRTYYETRHSRLSQKLLPMCTDYRRNYFNQETDRRRGGPLDFDVVTEMWFETKEAYQHFLDRCAEPDVLGALRADELNFLDPDSVRMLVVEEVRSPPSGYKG